MATIRAVAKMARHTYDVMERRLAHVGSDNGSLPRTMKVCRAVTCRACGKHPSRHRPSRIIYFAPAWDGPSGGTRVIYRHVEAMTEQGLPCFVFHPEKPGSSYTWITHHVQSLKTGHFDPQSDFLVFPEVWAALGARFCIPAGFKYAIFVQNGYLAHRTSGFAFTSVVEAYRHAALVLSISSDTSAMVELLFPFVERQRLLRVYCSVPSASAPMAKEPLITYMPRKLRNHAERLEFYLTSALPKDWRLVSIDDVPASQVSALMSKSSIFLSLSDMEGYGLPPLEAALCGNIVVGYSGQGAREYFSRPIFREVPNGDFRLFVSEVQCAVRDAGNGIRTSAIFLNQVAELAATHSAANEAAHVAAFARRAYAALYPQGNAPPADVRYGT